MRYIALDIGDKRTGAAVGDARGGMVEPLKTITAPIRDRRGENESLMEAIERLIADYGADALVLGLPLNMDGTEGPRARSVRDLGKRLVERAGLAVHYQDERLTSAAADWEMARSGMTRGQKKSRRDGLAAAAILRDFLAAQGSGDEAESGQ